MLAGGLRLLALLLAMPADGGKLHVLLRAQLAPQCAHALQGLEHALQQDGVAGQHSSPAELFDR